MPEVPDTVDDAIAPLVSPSTDEVFEATRPFSAREIGSAAVSEALSGGGGSQPLTVAPEPSLELGTDPDHPTEQPSPIKVDAPATHASSQAVSNGGYSRALAVTPGAGGNVLRIVLVEGGSSLGVGVSGTTVTFTGPNTTTYAEVAALGNSDPAVSALVFFLPDAQTDVLDFIGGLFDNFNGGYDAGAYVSLRLASRPSWYIHADGGVDIESTDGDFIAQIDIVNGAYIRQVVGASAGLTVVDSDYNEKLVAKAEGVGFNGATPSVPQIAASPSAQEIVDALVTLGLVTQA